jgi:hypothetical protein
VLKVKVNSTQAAILAEPKTQISHVDLVLISTFHSARICTCACIRPEPALTMPPPPLPSREQFLAAGTEPDTCNICFEPFNCSHHPVRFTSADSCGHVFGATCLKMWVESWNDNADKCPTCRRVLFRSETAFVGEEEQSEYEEEEQEEYEEEDDVDDEEEEEEEEEAVEDDEMELGDSDNDSEVGRLFPTPINRGEELYATTAYQTRRHNPIQQSEYEGAPFLRLEDITL